MKIPTLRGLIRRRLLINFRVDPAALQAQLPKPFRPKLQADHAIAGICLIRLEELRPAGLSAWAGLESENAAHRVAVEWTDRAGAHREGVFVFRRDTGSRLGHLAGGRLFPGVQHLANFRVIDDGRRFDFAMTSSDHPGISIRVRGAESDALPASSCFGSLAEASRFFERGCDGYSPSRGGKLDGMRLQVPQWVARPFAVDEVESTWFSALTNPFPGAVVFDHALVMRDIPHEWHAVEEAP